MRLRQGLSHEQTVYSDSPVEMAKQWAKAGGKYLHVIDFDGAFSGKPVHLAELTAICAAVDIPVQVGGGIRTDADIEAFLATGVARVVLGTRACEYPEELPRLVEKFGGDKIAVGIDACNGKVLTQGWRETTDVVAVDLAKLVCAAGVGSIIYTDTTRDGMLEGVNAFEMGKMALAVSCDIIASGGVSAPEDMKRLCALNCKNLTGALVGKALYEEAVTIKQLTAAMK